MAIEIPGYKIIEKIAEGGMATVYKASQLSLDRMVALKILNVGLIQRDADIERFRVEAQASAKIQHPGLCQIYDAGDVDGTVYYAMEYVSGVSVGQLLDRDGAMTERQALSIAFDVATILEVLWNKHKAVHCDIKPDNILVDNSGVVRVMDFGVARFIGTVTQELDANYFVGTPNYASPEQARGEADLDFRTDVYALGATLYHMLTGLMPFETEKPESVLECHCSGYLTDPQTLNPAISVEAACLLDKLMIKERSDRYTEWSSVLRDIEEVKMHRFPRGGLVPAWQSTVARSYERDEDAARRIDSMKPKLATVLPSTDPHETGPVQDPFETHQQKIKLKAKEGVLSGYSIHRPVRTEPTGVTAFFEMIFVALLVGAIFAGSFFLLLRPSAPVSRNAPVSVESSDSATSQEVSPLRGRRAAPAASGRRSTSEAASVSPVVPPPEEPSSRPEQEWPLPAYVEAVRILRETDTDLQQFLEDRDANLLASVEEDCHEAIALLESVRDVAPEEADVAEYIRRAFKMISDSRKMRSMAVD